MRRIAVVVLTLLLACGCARSGPQPGGQCPDSATAEAFPGDSLEDWVTYGDHLVTARVRPTDEEGRVELVPAATLWSRPAAPAAPGPLRRWADRGPLRSRTEGGPHLPDAAVQVESGRPSGGVGFD